MIASIIFLNLQGGIAASVLFSTGLLAILGMGYKLYTGAIGYTKNKTDIKNNLIILGGNCIGCLPAIIYHNKVMSYVTTIVTAKLSLNLLLVFFNAMICGMLIYIAVATFKEGRWYLTPFCVSGFILFGAEHCIADLCYLLAAHSFTLYSLLFFIVVVLGNSIGSIITHRLTIKK